jgi:tRNA (guanine-N7-)-methyltransferase
MIPSRPPIDITNNWIPFPTAPIAWSDIFGDARPVELEVGSGKGLFLANAARANPTRGYLGIEIVQKYAKEAAERLAKHRLANAKMLGGDARRFLQVFTPEASLDAIHIYFPDPWWKRRQRKRRVFCEEFIVEVSQCLKPAGEFHVATDVHEYFGVMQKLLAKHSEFLAITPSDLGPPQHELDYLTNFERKYRIEGRPIHRASYRLDTSFIAPARPSQQELSADPAHPAHRLLQREPWRLRGTGAATE